MFGEVDPLYYLIGTAIGWASIERPVCANIDLLSCRNRIICIVFASLVALVHPDWQARDE